MKQVFEIDEDQILKWAAEGFMRDNPHLEFDCKKAEDFIVAAWNDWGTRRYKIVANVSYKAQNKPVQAKGTIDDWEEALKRLRVLESKTRKSA